MARLKSATNFSTPRAKIWEFESDSNPSKHYQTVLYVDGKISCNCPGWTRQKSYGGNQDYSRTCRHVASVEMGTADEQAVAANDYRIEGLPEAVTDVLETNKAQAEAKKIAFGKRKLNL